MIEMIWQEVQIVNMNKIILNALSAFFVIFMMGGCSTVGESLSSQVEVPTLENQANRVAVGMAIVRENNIMAYKMPISADANWPDMVAKNIDEKTKKLIDKALMSDPYFATQNYSNYIQRKMLGSNQNLNSLGQYANLTAMILQQSVSPLTYRAFQKITIFYGRDKKNWPDIFNYDNSLKKFLDFKDGKFQEIDSPTGDVYPSIGQALISLTPVNLQKDLQEARRDMLDAYEDVASYKSAMGVIETKLKEKKKKNSSKRHKLQQELDSLKVKATEAESIADEKENIYFTLLEGARIAIQSDINLDDKNYVKLARNINVVAKEIYMGSTEAYASFSLALTNLASNNILENFPRELKSLAIAKASVPLNLQSKYNQRIVRLAKNAIYLLPNVFMGAYYASKQLLIARKYEKFTDIILVAYKTKQEQEKTKKIKQKGL